MKNKNLLVSIFLLIAFALVFIGCDTGTNTPNKEDLNFTNVTIDDIPSLEDLGLDTIEIPENLEEFTAPDGWTQVTSFDDIIGDWVTVVRGFDAPIEVISKMSLQIKADKIIIEEERDCSAVEDLDEFWQTVKSNDENNDYVTFDDENYIMTAHGEFPLPSSFEGFFGEIELLSTDKKTWVGLYISKDLETNEIEIFEIVFIKVN